MKDKDKAQQELQDAFTKFKKDYDASFDELAQQVGYALDAIKYPPATGAPPPPANEEAKPADKPTHAAAHHSKK